MAQTFYMSGISLIIQYFQNLGLMNSVGSVQTNLGGAVATPVTTYTDSTGATANANPLNLNSAGRPASASGAPVAFWVPGGTLVQLIVYDGPNATGNQIAFLDNIPAINDLTGNSSALQTLLASPLSANLAGTGPVAGVDLVANAVKSYDVFADVRAANMPILASGQTLNIEVQGGLAVNDGLGGFFYWSATSGVADDGRTVLKPNSISSGTPGRWLRYYPLGVPQIIVKPANQLVTSNTALQNDSALFLNLLGGSTYLVSLRLQLLGIGGTGQGYKVATSYTGTIGSNGGGGGVVSGNTTPVAAYIQATGTVANAAISSTPTTPDVVNLDFIITTGTTGTFAVQFAQNSSSANSTQMNAGSTITATRLA